MSHSTSPNSNRSDSGSEGSSQSTASVQSDTKYELPTICLKCKEQPVEFMTTSCHHPCFCRKCAMKCASGGRCKICNQFYGSLTRIR